MGGVDPLFRQLQRALEGWKHGFWMVLGKCWGTCVMLLYVVGNSVTSIFQLKNVRPGGCEVLLL